MKRFSAPFNLQPSIGKRMRLLYVLLLAAAIGLGVRAFVDYFETFHNTSHQIAGAARGTQDCQRIYRDVQFTDTELQRNIIAMCEQRANLGSRWILIESFKAWVSGLWFCDNLHCSEYFFPVLDHLGNAFRYSIFVTIATLFITLWYGLPAILGILLDRLRPRPAPGYCPTSHIPIGDTPYYYGHPQLSIKHQ